MQRILFLIHTLGGGGAEKVLVNLANMLSEKDYEITVMTVVDTGIYKSKLNPRIRYKTMLQKPHWRKTIRGWLLKKGKQADQIVESGSLLKKRTKGTGLLISLYTFFWKNVPCEWIYRCFIHEKYDYEVAFLEGICAKIIAASPNKDSWKYAWIHVDLEVQHKSKDVFKDHEEELHTYQKFDNIIGVSAYVKNQFIKLFPEIGEEKIKVAYNPINRDEIIALANDVPAHPIVEHKSLTICSVGRLNQQKAYMRLLECVYLLKQDGYDIKLWIIGEGTDKKNLERYIKEKSLGNEVALLGFQHNPYYYMKQADIYACSSIAEGFSTAVIEATIVGLPVVTTRCSGMDEILGDSEYGMITENNTQALYLGLKRMVSDNELRELYREKASKRGKEFNYVSGVKKIEEKLFVKHDTGK